MEERGMAREVRYNKDDNFFFLSFAVDGEEETNWVIYAAGDDGDFSSSKTSAAKTASMLSHHHEA